MNFKNIIAYIKHEFKKRYHAKRFNIWTETVDPKCNEGDWLSYDKKLYFGHPLFVFFESGHNKWWNQGESYFKDKPISSDRPPSDDLQPGEDDNNPYANCNGKQ